MGIMEKEYPKNIEREIKKVEWNSVDTIFLSGLILACFTTVLCFIL